MILECVAFSDVGFDRYKLIVQGAWRAAWRRSQVSAILLRKMNELWNQHGFKQTLSARAVDAWAQTFSRARRVLRCLAVTFGLFVTYLRFLLIFLGHPHRVRYSLTRCGLRMWNQYCRASETQSCLYLQIWLVKILRHHHKKWVPSND